MQYDSQYGQDKCVHETLFQSFHGGTFVEFRALDGLLDSNTLFFGREQGRAGVLVEPNPDAFALVIQNRANCRHESVAISVKIR